MTYSCKQCGRSFHLDYDGGIPLCSRRCFEIAWQSLHRNPEQLQEASLAAQIEQYDNRDVDALEKLRESFVKHLPPIEEFLK